MLPLWSLTRVLCDDIELALVVFVLVEEELALELKKEAGPLDGFEVNSAWYIGLSRVPTMQK
jgi:hypothetical protein